MWHVFCDGLKHENIVNCFEDESKFGAAILILSERDLFMVIFGYKDHLLTSGNKVLFASFRKTR